MTEIDDGFVNVQDLGVLPVGAGVRFLALRARYLVCPGLETLILRRLLAISLFLASGLWPASAHACSCATEGLPCGAAWRETERGASPLGSPPLIVALSRNPCQGFAIVMAVPVLSPSGS